MLPQEILEIRCTEIASKNILGQKHAVRSSYTWLVEYCIQYLAVHSWSTAPNVWLSTRGVLHPLFGCLLVEYCIQCLAVHSWSTVKPPNKGHIGDGPVVPFSFKPIGNNP